MAAAKSHWNFISSDFNRRGNNILWRHDVDYSVKSALTLASIEQEEGIKSTYFFLLNCEFYNLLAAEILKQVKAIASMGHHIGLHFDEAVLTEKKFSSEALSEQLEYEKKVLERYLEVPIETVSWHNPTEKCCLQNDRYMLCRYG